MRVRVAVRRDSVLSDAIDMKSDAPPALGVVANRGEADEPTTD